MISWQRACCSLFRSLIDGLTISQLFLTTDRSGWSNGKQICSRWALDSDAWNRATAVSASSEGEGPTLVCPAAAVALRPISGTEPARTPAPSVLSRSRRDSALQHSSSSNLESRGCAMGAISLSVLGPCLCQDRARSNDWQPGEVERDEMDGTTIRQNRAANRLSFQAQANRSGAAASTDPEIDRVDPAFPSLTLQAFLHDQGRITAVVRSPISKASGMPPVG